MAGDHDHRCLDLAAGDGKFDDVVFFDAQPGERCAGDLRGVVPTQVGYRLGEFLQPADVRPAAVVDAGVGTEDDFDGIFLQRRGNLATQLGRICSDG